MVISVLMLLIAPFIPHHHHEGVACVVVERCEADDTYNDQHTDHHDSSDGSESYASCIEKANYIVSKIQNNKTSVDNFNASLFVAILISQYNSFLCSDVDVRDAQKYGEYIITYKSAEIIKSNGLRGPPSVLAC